MSCAVGFFATLLLTSFAGAQPALPTEIAPVRPDRDSNVRDEATRMKQAAREAVKSADLAAAREHVHALLKMYREAHASGRSLNERYQWSQRLAEVTREFLRGGHLTDALQTLGEAADLELPYEERLDDGLGSATAGLYRKLVALDDLRRYELLRTWSMPTESRRSIRLMTALTPIDAPPTVFARALGERPRRDAFAVSQINGVQGIFSSAWLLVTSADQAGHLRRLSAELAS